MFIDHCVLTTHEMSDKATLHAMDILEFTSEMYIAMDEVIVSMIHGSRKISLELTKQKLKEWLKSKKGSTLHNGIIAEFLVHLVLNNMHYEPRFLFQSLEDAGVKRAFDGLYEKNSEMWLVESKSGSSLSKEISHSGKIKEAYKDIDKKLSGKAKAANSPAYDPWNNAYNHASHGDVKSPDSLKDRINLLSKNYQSGEYENICNHNIIPCSTIFYSQTCEIDKHDKLIITIENIMETLVCRKKIVLCLNQKNIEDFYKYLGE